MPREDGYKNLVPFSKRSKDEARSNGQLGGIASGAARRRKRSLRDAAELFLSLPPADVNVWNAVSVEGVAPEDVDNQMAVITVLYRAALTGDVKAAKLLFDLLGEDPRADGDQTEDSVEVVPLSKRLAQMEEIAKEFGGGHER